MKKILLVEETKPLARSIADILQMTGHDVHIAEDGKEGVEALYSYKPDLVITDIAMPVMDGLEFVRALRNDKKLYALPVVILSAKVTPEDIRKGKQAGADVYLKKPCSVDELLDTVSMLLNREIPSETLLA